MTAKSTSINQPLISVLLPTYKEEQDYFEQALISILSQTYTNFELYIILDDPNNIQIKNLAKKYAENDSRIILVANEHNKGIVQSLNDVIPLTKGEYICRMDADDVSKPRRLEKQLYFLIANNLDLVGGRTEVINEKSKALYSTPQLPQYPKQIKRALQWNNCVPHPTWLGKRFIFEQGYRNMPFSEDYDFLLRASLDNRRIGNCNDIVLSYRMTQNGISRSNLFQQYLAQLILTKGYKNAQIPSPEDVNDFIKKKYTKEKAKKYTTANSWFNEFLNFSTKKRSIKGLLRCFLIPFISKEYLNKIYRLVRAALCAKWVPKDSNNDRLA